MTTGDGGITTERSGVMSRRQDDPRSLGGAAANRFLDAIGRKLSTERPLVPKTLPFTLACEADVSGTFARLWFRTRGCRHTHRGDCTMCDYWISEHVTPSEMLSYVEQGLNELDVNPSSLLLETSGSFLDPWEGPPEARRAILQKIARIPPCTVTIETRAETVNARVLGECVTDLAERQLCVEMGIESADSWVLRYCVNKPSTLIKATRAATTVASAGATPIANVLIGIPFLSPGEAVDGAIRSIQRLLSEGFEHCVLFSVNTKRYTLAYWMEDKGLYQRLPLWALVDVLTEIDPALFQRLHPLYTSKYRGPEACPRCATKILELLDTWRPSGDRLPVLRGLQRVQCECRDQWIEERDHQPKEPLHERIVGLYARIGRELLGESWWEQHGESITRQRSRLPGECSVKVPRCEYDGLATIYDQWAAADPASGPSYDFYVDLYLRSSGEIAELGVGTGRIAVAAACSGRSVTGVDLSPSMLEVCRERAQELGVAAKVLLLLQDVRELTLPQPADLISLPFRSIGHLVGTADRRRLFERVFENLAPGGHFVFDHYLWNEEWARRYDGIPRLVASDHGAEGRLIWDTYRYDFPAKTMHCVITVQELDGDGVVTSTHAHPFDFSWITPDQVRELAYPVGFECEALCGDFFGNPLTADSTDQVWILRRPSDK